MAASAGNSNCILRTLRTIETRQEQPPSPHSKITVSYKIKLVKLVLKNIIHDPPTGPSLKLAFFNNKRN